MPRRRALAAETNMPKGALPFGTGGPLERRCARAASARRYRNAAAATWRGDWRTGGSTRRTARSRGRIAGGWPKKRVGLPCRRFGSIVQAVRCIYIHCPPGKVRRRPIGGAHDGNRHRSSRRQAGRDRDLCAARQRVRVRQPEADDARPQYDLRRGAASGRPARGPARADVGDHRHWNPSKSVAWAR